MKRRRRFKWDLATWLENAFEKQMELEHSIAADLEELAAEMKADREAAEGKEPALREEEA